MEYRFCIPQQGKKNVTEKTEYIDVPLLCKENYPELGSKVASLSESRKSPFWFYVEIHRNDGQGTQRLHYDFIHIYQPLRSVNFFLCGV